MQASELTPAETGQPPLSSTEHFTDGADADRPEMRSPIADSLGTGTEPSQTDSVGGGPGERTDESYTEPEHADPLLVDEINNSPVTVSMEREGAMKLIKVTLPGGCEFEGKLTGSVALAAWLKVPKGLRGHGFGERLVRGLTAALVDNGAKTLHSGIRNPAALKIREKVFGRENLKFFDQPGDDPSITFEQAMEFLDQATLKEEDLENRKIGIGVSVDLTRIDTSGPEWERPAQPEPLQFTPADDDQWL